MYGDMNVISITLTKMEWSSKESPAEQHCPKPLSISPASLSKQTQSLMNEQQMNNKGRMHQQIDVLSLPLSTLNRR